MRIRTKLLFGTLVGLALALGLVPGMMLTAYADISSVEIVTAGDRITTYKDTDENFTITCSDADGDGMKLSWGDINISAKDDDHIIRKVELTIGWYPQYAPNVVSDKGTITLPEDLNPDTGKGGIITIDGVNSKTLKLSHNNYTAPQLKKVKIYYGESAHTHSFTYSAKDATITATCTADGCDITEGLTLTISAPTGELVSDGKTTFPATLSEGYPATLSEVYHDTAFPGDYPISYTKDGSAYDGEPREAGAYTASVTVGAATASVDYVVTAPTHAVTVRVIPDGAGTVGLLSEPQFAEGEPQFAEGATVGIEAKPAEGYEFERWTVDGEGASIDDATKAQATLTMGTADAKVTANFRKTASSAATYKIAVTQAPRARP